MVKTLALPALRWWLRRCYDHMDRRFDLPVTEYAFQQTPVCFARKADFQEELRTRYSVGRERIVALLSQERNCSAFTPRQQGFTPKEHREMLDRRWERKWRVIEMIVVGIAIPALIIAATILAAFIQARAR